MEFWKAVFGRLQKMSDRSVSHPLPPRYFPVRLSSSSDFLAGRRQRFPFCGLAGSSSAPAFSAALQQPIGSSSPAVNATGRLLPKWIWRATRKEAAKLRLIVSPEVVVPLWFLPTTTTSQPSCGNNLEVVDQTLQHQTTTSRLRAFTFLAVVSANSVIQICV